MTGVPVGPAGTVARRIYRQLAEKPLAYVGQIADDTPIDPGVSLQLLSGGSVVASALTGSDGTVTFDVAPATLTSPAVNLSPRQTRPA